MIRAAHVRATVSQIEKYKTALTTFRIKFNAIPGDMNYLEAPAFGLFALNPGTTGFGDANGRVEGGAALSALPEGEILLFWRQLADANLIEGNLGNKGIKTGTGYTQASTNNNPGDYLPITKIGTRNYFTVYSTGGVNYFQTLPLTQILDTPAWTYGTTGLTPIDSFNIDNKLDDGLPNTGSVVARSIALVAAAPSVSASSAANKCTIGTGVTTDTYNLNSSSGGNDPSCAVRVPTQ